MNETCLNTDKEIWKKIPGDYYSPSIHITEFGGIGINVGAKILFRAHGGYVLVAPIEKWHKAGIKAFTIPDPNDLITSRFTLTAKAQRFWNKLVSIVCFCGK